ncbi:ATP-binding protein [Blastococcus sp. SYSU D00813]
MARVTGTTGKSRRAKDTQFDVVRPDPAGTIQSLASLGYTPEAAVADLVDNSIAAKSKAIRVEFRWEGADESWAAIVDDGQGMDEEALLRGLTVGGRGLDERDRGDLGRFGMGLKTASFSQARQLIVASRPGPGPWLIRTWDVDHVLEVGDWELMRGCPPSALAILEDLTASTSGSGTVVLWRRLTRLVAADSRPGDDWAKREFYTLVERIERHLGMVFARYLSKRASRLSMSLNGRPIAGWDPFLGAHKFVEALPLERPLPGVTVQGYVLPHRSRLTDDEYLDGGGPRGWLDQQGFYVYRRDRLIVAGDWLKLSNFRKDEKHTLARIAVDLPPEQDLEWALDVKKSTATPPPALVRHLARVGKATRERAGAVISHRGRVVRDRQTSSEDFTWKTLSQFGQTRFVLNREHVLIREMIDRNPSVRSDLNAVLTMIESTLPVGLIRTTPEATVRPSAASDDEVVPDDVLEMASRMLEVMLNRRVSPADALGRVTRMPPFSDYPALASLLSGTDQA